VANDDEDKYKKELENKWKELKDSNGRIKEQKNELKKLMI
jgi:hypothetical protein